MTLQMFLAPATRKAYADLEAALLNLPEDKRNWSPGGSARTAADQVAECALMNGMTIELIQNRAFPADFDWGAYAQKRAELATDWPALQTLLRENTEGFIATLETVPTENLDIKIAMPWRPMTIAQILSYPFWNMCYHEGQINYIGSLLTE